MSDLKLLLDPHQRQSLRDAAHRLGVREQVIARNAVLNALNDSSILNRAASPGGSSNPDMLRSLHKLAKQLAETQRTLDELLLRVKTNGLPDTSLAPEDEADDAIAEGDAIADEIEKDC